MKHFRVTEEELDILTLAPVWVVLLVAGADGTITRKERQEAQAIMQKWCDCIDSDSPDLWRDLVENFETNIKGYQMLLPADQDRRNEILSSKISQLNSFLNKLDTAFSERYVSFLRDLAQKVANASGGLFGYRNVQAVELKFIELPMIDFPGQKQDS